jgi:hypothetical protein
VDLAAAPGRVRLRLRCRRAVVHGRDVRAVVLARRRLDLGRHVGDHLALADHLAFFCDLGVGGGRYEKSGDKGKES